MRLGGVIYVPGLAENLLSLEALHLANYVLTGSKEGYELKKNGKIVAHGKRIGQSTYLDSVKHENTLLVSPNVAKRTQYTQMALSADEATARKQTLIHSRLGHPGRHRYNECLEMMDLDKDELRLPQDDKLLDNSCEVCSKAKKHKNQSHMPVRRASLPLQRVYMDFWGPSKEMMGNVRYFLSLIDDHTRYSWLFVKPDRKVESLIQTLDTWLPHVEHQSGQLLLVIRTDNTTEFKVLVAWGAPKGIEFEFIEPGTPPQNGVAERFNKIIMEIARAVLFNARIHKKYWKYAVLVTDYLQNRTTFVKDSEGEDGRKRTPYELWTGHQPDLSNLQAWGCRVIYHEKNLDSKLDSRVAEGTFLLYGKSNKQYYVLPHGGSELRLVTNPEFRERERGYLDPPGYEFSQIPTPEMPKLRDGNVQLGGGSCSAMREAPLTSGAAGGGQGEPADEMKCQYEPLSAPREAPTPQNENEMNTDPDPPRPSEGSPPRPSEDKPASPPANGEAVSKKQEMPTHDQPAEDPHIVDADPNQDAQVSQIGEENNEVQSKGDKETLKEPTPGQPRDEDSYEERFHRPEMELGEATLSRPQGPEPQDNEQQRQNKVTPQTVYEEWPDVHRSSRIRQPMERSLESLDQQEYGRKRKPEGEEIDDRPAQHLRARMAKLAVATELLIGDHKFEVNEQARAA